MKSTLKKQRPPATSAASLFACSLLSLSSAGAQVAEDAARQPAAPDGEKAELPVQRVALFSSGVGYFEHAGTVVGAAGAELRFTTKQVNDVLKSLVLQDLDGGSVAAVTYPSLDPLEKTLGSFQINISENPSMAALLNQIRGAQVTLSMEIQEITGTVLGVETRERHIVGSDEVIEEHHLNLFSAGTIRSVALANVRDIRIHDPQLQEELDKALSAVAQARDQDKKPVSLHFEGQGERRVRAGYVVETPVWKTSYRLLLNDEQAPLLQGWAIVENQTDNDWNNVELSLISGRPISFTQDLYQPLYMPRPEVTPEHFSSLRPQMYQEGMLERRKDMRGQPEAAMAPRQEMAAKADGFARRRSEGAMAGRAMEVPASAMDAAASVASVAEAENFGELFQYTVDSVSLPRQQSALIPIITDALEAQRLSIYNKEVLEKHPLNGVRLINRGDDAKHLLQGPVTVFDTGQYAGDARLNDTPPGQERLLSYGVDLNMLVDSEKVAEESIVQTGSIVKGVLRIQRKNIASREYLAENKSERDRQLLIEHRFRQGWDLVKPTDPVETTHSHYRFEVTVPAGEQLALPVQEERVQMETLAILPADFGQLEFYQRSGAIPQNVRDALAKAMEMKHRMVDLQRQINHRVQEVNRITEEQQRIRENLKTVSQQSDYRTRLLKKLDEQESEIEKLNLERADLQEKFEQQQADLEDYLSALTIE